ncbi:hypothetical protein T484DRAFT_1761150 [Baffinella frigidus]|nr:hypothetical protein T484DRAFT_1761150 [Cryptophyta sp. CCMP2293]
MWKACAVLALLVNARVTGHADAEANWFKKFFASVCSISETRPVLVEDVVVKDVFEFLPPGARRSDTRLLVHMRIYIEETQSLRKAVHRLADVTSSGLFRDMLAKFETPNPNP